MWKKQMLSLLYRIYGLTQEIHVWQIIITKGEEYMDLVSTGWKQELGWKEGTGRGIGFEESDVSRRRLTNGFGIWRWKLTVYPQDFERLMADSGIGPSKDWEEFFIMSFFWMFFINVFLMNFQINWGGGREGGSKGWKQ